MDPIPIVMPVSRLFNTEIAEYWNYSEDEEDDGKDPIIIQNLFGNSDEILMTEPKAEHKTEKEVVWSTEEDEVLVSLASLYQYNWDFLADMLYCSRFSPVKRSDRDCYSRYTNLTARGYKSSVDFDPSALPIRAGNITVFNAHHVDTERLKLAKFMSKFDLIGKASKKKDSSKQNSMIFFAYNLDTTKNNRSQVNLNSHETHLQTQIHAGIDILGRPLTPLELTQLKEQRASEFRAAQEQQKHATFFSGMQKVLLTLNY